MIDKIKSFIFDKFAGKILARVAVTIASALTAGPVAEFLASLGIKATISDAELTAGLIAFGHAAYEWFKKKTSKAPAPAPEAAKA